MGNIKLRPLGERVLIKRDEAKATAGNGVILVPETAKEKQSTGVVCAIGAACKEGLRVGDRVLFGDYAGSDVVVEGEKLLVANERDLRLVFEEI